MTTLETEVARAKEFLEISNPHAWWLSANDLFEQAADAYRRRGTVALTKLDGDGNVMDRLDGVDRTCFLLGGFALENMLKSILVFDCPELVRAGKIAKRLQSHKLANMFDEVDIGSRKAGDRELLLLFEDGIQSWARYPCALSHDRSNHPTAMSTGIWDAFSDLFGRLDLAARQRMTTGWNGPYGLYGRFTFQGLEV